MPSTRNIVAISILMVLCALPATAQEPAADTAPVTQVLSQMVEDVLNWFDDLIELPQTNGGDDEFSPMIEPGG